MKILKSEITDFRVKNIIDLAKVESDGKYYYFPDSLNKPYESFICDYYSKAYFYISGYKGHYDIVDLSNIVGTADIDVGKKENWLEAILKPRNFFDSYKMASSHIDYYKTGCFNEDDVIELFRINDKYYVIDGNHRVNVLKLLVACNPDGPYLPRIKAWVRHLPSNKLFIETFVRMVEHNKMYDVSVDPYDGYQTFTPHFKVTGDYSNPTIIHLASNRELKTVEDLQQFELDYKEIIVPKR